MNEIDIIVIKSLLKNPIIIGFFLIIQLIIIYKLWGLL